MRLLDRMARRGPVLIRGPHKHISVASASLLLAGGSVIAPSVDVTSKYLSGIYPILCIVWARYCGHAIFALAFSLLSGVGVGQLRPSSVQVVRGLVQFISTLLFVMALSRLTVNTALVIVFLAPLFVVIFRWALKAEGADALAVGIAAAGALGTAFAYAPSIGRMDLAGIACALGAALHLSIYFMLTGYVAREDEPMVSTLHTAVPGALLGLPVLGLMPFAPKAPDAPVFLWLGLGSVLSHWLICLAMRTRFSSTISPIAYVEIPAGALYAFTLFHQTPTLSEVVGGGIVLICGTLLSVRLARRPNPAGGGCSGGAAGQAATPK